MEYITLIKSPPLGLLTLEMVHATSNQIKRKVLNFIPLDEAPFSEDLRSKLALQALASTSSSPSSSLTHQDTFSSKTHTLKLRTMEGSLLGFHSLIWRLRNEP